jgi:hypothetical protein
MLNKPIASVADKDHRLAVIAEVLYLGNISIVPVLGFVCLLIIYFRTVKKDYPFAVHHLRQAIVASIVSGLLLIVVSLLIIILGGFSSAYTWMLLILYFTCIHSMLILFGVFGITRAANDREYYYPLIGRIWV